ncbi:two component transcriptional regulator, LuxR family [Promicromonospora thailandica]|uniref:Two component transcriptional regulator, LuxR family n=1 Tax=Promicromonospora thailandica TaxID=765201 RepID=A0A9X2JVD0_9MICO|nr:two component transcriptional regulator, LuxR family [Promicromonospora thailandica]BFF20913.1 response regulator transcription factor [Promicromonospora thailandica]
MWTVTRVLIVDDDSFARTMIRTILAAQGIDVVGEAADGDEVPAAVAEHRPDIVLVDLQMRRVDGVEAIRRNASLPGAPRFVALTGYGNEDAVVQALRAGAAGFLSKDDDPSTLATHLRAVADGGGALGPDAAALVIQRMTTPEGQDRAAAARTQLQLLTEREREVAALVAGYTNQQIGTRLGMSDNTVKAHVTRALTKLGMNNRAELAVLADRAGLTA